jgi:hypothetical protein
MRLSVYFYSLCLFILCIGTSNAADSFAEPVYPIGDTYSDLQLSDVSADGNLLVVLSSEWQIEGVPTELKSNRRDVYLKDISADAIIKITIGIDGATADRSSNYAALFGEQYVLFESSATNLIENGDNNSDLYLYNISTKKTSLLRTSDGQSTISGSVRVSADGAFAFYISSSGLYQLNTQTLAFERRDISLDNYSSLLGVSNAGSALLTRYNSNSNSYRKVVVKLDNSVLELPSSYDGMGDGAFSASGQFVAFVNTQKQQLEIIDVDSDSLDTQIHNSNTSIAKLTSSDLDISDDGRYVATQMQPVVSYQETKGESSTKSIFVLDTNTGQAIKASVMSDTEVDGVFRQARFDGLNNNIYFIKGESYSPNQIIKLSFSEDTFEFDAGIDSLDVTSVEPLSATIRVFSEATHFSVKRTNVVTGSSDYFLSHSSTNIDFRYGLEIGEFEYEISACSTNLVCNETDTKSKTITIKSFAEQPTIDYEYTVADILTSSPYLSVSSSLSENADIVQLNFITGLINLTDKAVNVRIFSGKDMALFGRLCINNYSIGYFNQSYSCGEYSEPRVVSIPKVLSSKQIVARPLPDFSGIKVQWQSKSGYSYKLYRGGRTASGDEYEYSLLHSGSDNQFIDSGIEVGQYAIYKLEQCVNDICIITNSNQVLFDRSRAPLSFTTQSHYGLVNVSFSQTYAFDKIKLYRTQQNSSLPEVLLAELDAFNAEYLDYLVSPATVYKYRVVGCYKTTCDFENTRYQSVYTANINKLPTTPKNLHAELTHFLGATLTWDKVEGADGYLVNVVSNDLSVNTTLTSTGNDSTEIRHRFEDNIGYQFEYSVHSFVYDNITGENIEASSLPSGTVSVNSINSVKRDVVLPVEVTKNQNQSGQSINWYTKTGEDYYLAYKRVKGEESLELLGTKRLPYYSQSVSVNETVSVDTTFEYFVVGCSYITQTCGDTDNAIELTLFADHAVPLVTSAPTVTWDSQGFVKVEPNIPVSSLINRIYANFYRDGRSSAFERQNISASSGVFASRHYSLASGEKIRVTTQYCFYASGGCSEDSDEATLDIPLSARMIPSAQSINSIKAKVNDDNTTATVSFYTSIDLVGPNLAGELRVHKATNNGPLEIVKIEKRINTRFTNGSYTYEEPVEVGLNVRYQIQFCNSVGCSKLSPSRAITIADISSLSIPSVPSIHSIATTNSWNSLNVEFNKVDSATSYNLFTSESPDDFNSNNRYTETTALVRNLEPDTTYYFALEACNDAGCSEMSVASSGKTLGQSSLSASISEQNLRDLDYSSGNFWGFDGVVKAKYGRLDAAQGELNLLAWTALEKGLITQTEAFLSISNQNSCATLLSHGLKLSARQSYSVAHVRNTFEIFYTGAGCDADLDLELYSLYIDSPYLDVPVLIENKDEWLGQWIDLTLSIDELGVIQLNKADTVIFVAEKTLEMDVFALSQIQWVAHPNSWISKVEVNSLAEAQPLIDFILSTSYYFSVSTKHPRMQEVAQQGNKLVELILVSDEGYADKILFAENELFEGVRQYHYIPELRPGTTYKWLFRYCQANVCGPFYVHEEKTSLYSEIQNFNRPHFSDSSQEGEIGIAAYVNNRFYVDEFVLFGRKADETESTELFTSSYLDPIEGLAGAEYNQISWTVSDYQPGEEVYFSLKVCNPLGCFTTAETNAITVPIDTDQDGVTDTLDRFPNDPYESADTDSDGVGNNADEDDDGDGIPDLVEIELGLDSLNAVDAIGDLDSDGVNNLVEYLLGSVLDDAEQSPKKNGIFVSFEQDESIPIRISYPYTSYIPSFGLPKIEGWRVLRKEFFDNQDSLTFNISGQMKKGRLGFAYLFSRSGSVAIDINGKSVTDNEVVVTPLGDKWFYHSIGVEEGFADVSITFNNSSSPTLLVDALFIPMVNPSVAGDFDGDGRAEIAVRNPLNYQNYWKELADTDYNEEQFGRVSNDIPISGDFDGDGKADWAVRRRANQTWYVKQSSDGEIISKRFGMQSSDIPVPADYDGDGITDFAVRRPSTSSWYILQSSDGQLKTYRFGLQRSDIPVPADYDGDGKADIAIRRTSNGTWYVLRSLDNKVEVTRFGLQANDIPVPADYDGDGNADIAVRRASDRTWYILQSSDKKIRRVRFGIQAEDIPVVADYDGDGKADIAVRRPSNYMWYILQSSSNEIHSEEFGRNSKMVPVLAPVLQRLSMTRNVSAQSKENEFGTFDDGYEELLQYKETTSPISPEFKGMQVEDISAEH